MLKTTMPSTQPLAAIFKLLLVPSVLDKNEYTVSKDARAGYSRRIKILSVTFFEGDRA